MPLSQASVSSYNSFRSLKGKSNSSRTERYSFSSQPNATLNSFLSFSKQILRYKLWKGVRKDQSTSLPSPGKSSMWNKRNTARRTDLKVISTKDLNFFLNSERKILCCGRSCRREDRMCMSPVANMLKSVFKTSRWPQPKALACV